MREHARYASDGTLAPGESASLRTAFGPFGKGKAGKYVAAVTRATVAE